MAQSWLFAASVYTSTGNDQLKWRDTDLKQTKVVIQCTALHWFV